jgi:hypothetical protein
MTSGASTVSLEAMCKITYKLLGITFLAVFASLAITFLKAICSKSAECPGGKKREKRGISPLFSIFYIKVHLLV